MPQVDSAPEPPAPVLGELAALLPADRELGNFLARVKEKGAFSRALELLGRLWSDESPTAGGWLSAMRDPIVVRRMLRLQHFFRQGQESGRWGEAVQQEGTLWPPAGSAPVEDDAWVDMEVPEEDHAALLLAHQKVQELLPDLFMDAQEYLPLGENTKEIGNVAFGLDPPLVSICLQPPPFSCPLSGCVEGRGSGLLR